MIEDIIEAELKDGQELMEKLDKLEDEAYKFSCAMQGRGFYPSNPIASGIRQNVLEGVMNRILQETKMIYLLGFVRIQYEREKWRKGRLVNLIDVKDSVFALLDKKLIAKAIIDEFFWDCPDTLKKTVTIRNSPIVNALRYAVHFLLNRPMDDMVEIETQIKVKELPKKNLVKIEFSNFLLDKILDYRDGRI